MFQCETEAVSSLAIEASNFETTTLICGCLGFQVQHFVLPSIDFMPHLQQPIIPVRFASNELLNRNYFFCLSISIEYIGDILSAHIAR